jgi:glycosyltransferase involved in cell wall biosynthesis
MDRTLEISAVLPAFNEEENLEAVARDLIESLARVAGRFEVIIVDDGSTDGTAKIADDLARGDERVSVVHHESNKGYGAALVSGFKAARMDWIFFMDSDGQFEPAEVEKLIELTRETDFVAGFRATRADPWQRLAYGKLFSAIVRALFGVRARDVNCAFKLFKKELIEGHEFIAAGALINAELLSVAKKRGVDPVETPVTHKPRLAGRSTGGSLTVILRAGREIIELWLKAGRG